MLTRRWPATPTRSWFGPIRTASPSACAATRSSPIRTASSRISSGPACPGARTPRQGRRQRRRARWDWDTYREPWIAALAHFGHYEPADAERTLRTVLPDVPRFDRSRPAAYPNGRTLTDDVTSARLTMPSNGRITSDHIGPHTDLLPDFPCLGAPHPA
ncbi:DUF4331 domain-containing protein [Embleya hyalina]|uniref:DUF4331 domain-containing protein n=1 Tax=Embleya hyalina TaxID=516124 RepID=UPI001FE323F1|nr:DUF4331 domain-containing protein [Embleya hyalina]